MDLQPREAAVHRKEASGKGAAEVSLRRGPWILIVNTRLRPAF